MQLHYRQPILLDHPLTVCGCGRAVLIVMGTMCQNSTIIFSRTRLLARATIRCDSRYNLYQLDYNLPIAAV